MTVEQFTFEKDIKENIRFLNRVYTENVINDLFSLTEFVDIYDY